MAEGDLDDRQPSEDLEHGVAALFLDSHLDERGSCLPPIAPKLQGSSVEWMPASASGGRSGAASELSLTDRSHGGNHVPGLHGQMQEGCWRRRPESDR